MNATDYVAVRSDALKRLLDRVSPGGWHSNELGIAYEDDGSGYTRRVVSADGMVVAEGQGHD